MAPPTTFFLEEIVHLRRSRLIVGLTFSLALLTINALAVETKVIRDESFNDFNQGDSTGTELLAQGRLRIAPTARRLEKTDEGVAWQVVTDPYDGSIFYSTGHQGKVFHRTADGKNELWADLPEVEALSLAVDPTGGVLVGASPGGKIYRIVQPGKPQLYFETGEQYIWDMIFDRNGVLYAATGPNGKIFRIRGQNNGELFYDSDATNVMALGFDREGKLIAATQGKAFVLRLSGPREGYVLYASREDECRALTVDREGNIYVAVNSARISSVFERPQPKEPKPEGEGIVQTMPRPAATPMATPTPQPPGAGFGAALGGNSAIMQIQPNGFVSTFWQAPEGPVQAMLADAATSSILVAAGNKGKIYSLQSNANYSVVADVEEPMVLSFAQYKEHTYFVTANKASLYELISAPMRVGEFASRTLNAGSTVHWGNLAYDAEETSGAEISFETRSGNTPDPEDKTWSAWAPAERVAPKILKLNSPVAQYLQYRLVMRVAAGQESPVIDSVQLFFVQQNVAPLLKEIRIEKVGGEQPRPQTAQVAVVMAMQRAAIMARAASPGEGGQGQGQPSASSSSSASERPGSASGQGPEASSGAPRPDSSDSGPFSSSVGVQENSQKINISWDSSDPNGDKLLYRLYFKGEDETEWKTIEKELKTERYTFSTEAIPDGQYRFKVEATDVLQNPETSASTVSLVSRIYTVDNTPPTVEQLSGRKVGNNEYEITATAADATSIISAAEYNIDAAKEWRAVFPEDGIFDFNREVFRFRVRPEEPSPEHTLSLRVYDREGNSHVAKVLLRP